MKAQFLILLSCLNLAAAVTDLGVISPQRGIQIESPSTRSDFFSFTIESRSDETINTLTITNNLIEVDDLALLPSGRSVIAVWANFRDGSHSEVALATLDLRRSKAPAPLLRPIGVWSLSDPPNSLTNELRKIRGSAVVPPMPGDWPHKYFSTNIAGYRGPIEDYLNRTNPITWNPADYTNQEPTGMATVDVLIRFNTNEATATSFTIDPTLATNLAYCWYRLATNVNCQSTNHDHEVINEHGSRFVPKPLPGGTNNSYAQYLDWLADRKGKRRNE